MAPDQRVPELVGGVDIRSLPLTAIDGFVFSRIDGRSSNLEIVAMTGLAREQVQAILERLVELGAVRWKSDPVPARPTAPMPLVPGTLRTPRPRTPPPRASGAPPALGSTHPRRRPSSSGQPRRMLSESSITAPPPDMRAFSQRPGAPTPASSSPRARTPPPNAHRESREPRTSSAPHDSTPERNTTAGPVAPVLPSDLATEHPTIEIHARGATSTSAPPSYDPRELEEEVELAPELRKQILDLYYRLPKLDYYQALGLAYGADKKDIRAAYFALSKVFHPDSKFRKQLGSYKAKMTKVFQYLTEAYDTLSKKKTRDEYDVYLRSTRSVEQAERALATEEVAVAEANVEVPRPPLLPSTDYAMPPATPVPEAAPEPVPEVAPEPARELSPEARRVARELFERRLRGLPQPSAHKPEPKFEPASPESRAPTSAADDRKERARQLTRTLIDVGRTTGNADKLPRTLAAAKSAFERGEIALAVQHMARAIALAPERSDLHTEYERLSRMLAHNLADAYIEQAKFEVKHGKWASAALSWAKVCEGRPDDGAAHRAAALSLLKAGGDMRGAQKYAQRAVRLLPTDIDARILLAQIYLTVGLKLNAKRELDAAAKLDPENEMVKNLLSDLKA